ncbi:hypothetical protein [Paenibacillus sp. N3.4]|uniref:hypothetical protein n=1 Tax=Paenibacillus sp. N3.4 TaxID=2603222 RepID=UPI0011CBC537|nr:hypothetical protein [Paenibacillus sp. N3.4]TXK83790.1 hypothetical protein FU659_11915 [Paenibacillus sp. N3.4]
MHESIRQEKSNEADSEDDHGVPYRIAALNRAYDLAAGLEFSFGSALQTLLVPKNCIIAATFCSVSKRPKAWRVRMLLRNCTGIFLLMALTAIQ